MIFLSNKHKKFAFNMLCQNWKITDRAREEPNSNLHFYNLDFWLLRVNWNGRMYPQGSPNSTEYFDIPVMRFIYLILVMGYLDST